MSEIDRIKRNRKHQSLTPPPTSTQGLSPMQLPTVRTTRPIPASISIPIMAKWKRRTPRATTWINDNKSYITLSGAAKNRERKKRQNEISGASTGLLLEPIANILWRAKPSSGSLVNFFSKRNPQTAHYRTRKMSSSTLMGFLHACTGDHRHRRLQCSRTHECFWKPKRMITLIRYKTRTGMNYK